jgi:oxalate decarboxylase/phosphoglucose isomerase-like protein (cupin superfamily)
MRLKPGGIRELHWHVIAGEWAFVTTGKLCTTVVNPNREYRPAPQHEPGSPARFLRYD